MTWQSVEGHDEVAEQFRTAIARGRLASTFLFLGPSGIGKRTFATRLAQALLCRQTADQTLEACHSCSDCAQVVAGTHPDFEYVSLPVGRSAIPLELLIGDKGHRMRDGLCHRIALKPRPGSRKVAIIDDTDHLNPEGANCLLKTLEEPPPRAVIMLIGTSQQRQLPTIRSRSQIVRFQPLESSIIQRLLQEQEIATSDEDAEQLTQLAGGSLSRAMQWSEANLRQFRTHFLADLAGMNWDRIEVSKSVVACMDDAGTETALKRARLRCLIEEASHFYHELMRRLCGLATERDQPFEKAVTAAIQSWHAGEEAAANCSQRCVEAIRQIDANANVNALVAAWIDDLGRFSIGEPMPID